MSTRSQTSGEKEPKSRWFIGIFGLLLIGLGYYLVLTEKGLLKSIPIFFLAAMLVIAGTYCLFISVTIIILKIVKNNKKHYYKAENFLSISGMLYRMKSNAVGLASIAVLSCGIILAISSTYSIFLSLDNYLENSFPDGYQYKIYSCNLPITISDEEYANRKKSFQEVIQSQLTSENNHSTRKIAQFNQNSIYTYLRENELYPIEKFNQEDYISDFIKDEGRYVFLDTNESYKALTGSIGDLKDNQVYLASNNNDQLTGKTLTIAEKEYEVLASEIKVPSEMAISSLIIYFPSMEDFKRVSDYYFIPDKTSDVAYFNLVSMWETDRTIENFNDLVNTYNKNVDKDSPVRILSYESKEGLEKSLSELYGGFVYLGLIISAVLLCGMILVMYYKQISEGYEDKRQYKIMQQVGLPSSLIKKASNKQILWLFCLPLAIAIIHVLVASPILFNALKLFGERSYINMFSKISIVILFFIVIYGIIYFITSRVYFNIVKNQDSDSIQVSN